MFRFALTTLCLLLLLSGGSLSAQDAKKVNIGLPTTIFRDVPASFHNVAKKPFQDLLHRLAGISGEVELIPDPLVVAEKLNSGKIDLCVLQGHEYAWIRDKYPDLIPIVMASQLRDMPIQSVILVRTTDKGTSLKDFDGRTLSYPEGTKDHSRLFMNREYDRMPGSFREVSRPQMPHDGIDEVIDGAADVCIVDKASLESYQYIYKGRSKKVRVLATSEIFPAGVVVCRKGGLAPSTQDAIRKGLLSAGTDSKGQYLLNLMKLKGFEALPTSYATLLDEIVKAYPAPKNVLHLTSFEKKK